MANFKFVFAFVVSALPLKALERKYYFCETKNSKWWSRLRWSCLFSLFECCRFGGFFSFIFACLRIGTLGSGSDYTAYLQWLGISSLSLDYSPASFEMCRSKKFLLLFFVFTKVKVYCAWWVNMQHVCMRVCVYVCGESVYVCECVCACLCVRVMYVCTCMDVYKCACMRIYEYMCMCVFYSVCILVCTGGNVNAWTCVSALRWPLTFTSW